MKLYKTFKRSFAPIMASVFTAIGSSGAAPRNFLKGIITSLPKPGNSLLVANTRPISLLGTDYRVLTRCLGGRLGAVLPALIDPVQTAFLSGRHIGDNVMLLQCLPPWLQQQGRSALMVFCDFRKAYDTVDREFLFALALKFGLGEGFVSWMKLLLTDTRSAAIIDGYLSDYRLLLAGVRQGDPLAPLIYLLIAQAALMWLKEKGFGIDIDNGRYKLTATQHADDFKAYLNGKHEVPALIAAMTVFGDASNQRLQSTKTRVLPIGSPPEEPLLASIHGLPVVSSVTALGLTFSQFTGEISVDWDELILRVHSKVSRIVKCKLSCFGRAFAVNTYALSKILYFAQFTDLPARKKLSYLERLLAAAVDHDECLALPRWLDSLARPNNRKRRFTGISRVLMAAHPRHAGLGLLPLSEHVTSRHAWWALRFITGPPTIPWIYLGRAILAKLLSNVKSVSGSRGVLVPFPCPQLVLLSRLPLGLAAPLGVTADAVPAVLDRFCRALYALPSLTVVAPVPAGPWCGSLPLWSNPLLRPGGVMSLEDGLTASFIACPALVSIRDLLRTRQELVKF
jgi:hypothetical protein